MSKYYERTVLGSFTVIVLWGAVFGLQYAYSVQRVRVRAAATPFSAPFLRAVDLGLHSALASFLWIGARTELPFLQNGYEKFAGDLRAITALDPKWSTPYAYTTLVLPFAAEYPDRFRAALAVGEEGLRQADPDWRIPFYMAVIYQLYLENPEAAARYFDVAARTPEIPDAVRQFAENFGAFPTVREQVRGLWTALFGTADDPAIAARAKAQIARLDALDMLETAVAEYRARFGAYPEHIEELVERGVIEAMPEDPFGFKFFLYPGGRAGFK